MTGRSRTVARWGSFAAGAALLAPLLSGWTIAGGVASGAEITLAPQRHAELDVQPVASPLARKTLVPSERDGGVGGVVSVRNATRETLEVTLRAGVETRALDQLLRLRLQAGGRTLFSGSLGSLRRGASLGPLPSHATLTVRVETWLAPDAGPAYRARKERISLSFVTQPGGRSP